MAYVWKLVCGDETLNLHDSTNYKVAYHEGRFYTTGDLELPIIIQSSGGAAIGTGQRLKREIDRYLAKARAWESSRQGKPVDLVCKLDDGLGDIEPLYGRGHMRKRILDGAVIMPNLNPTDVSAGRLRLTLQIKSRPYYHGKLADVADATGWVREVADKGLEVWEATTNLFVNPCLAFATDWDQRWGVYNATDLTLAQSTSIWRSLGSAAKLTASATLPGVFYDDLTLTNAAHTLSCYVHKEGAVPTTNDVEMWAGHVYENFTTAAAAPTLPLVEATAGGGASAGAGGEWQLNTSAANADGAIIYYNTAFDADKIFRIRVRFRCPTVTHFVSTVFSLIDKNAVPAITAGGAGTGGGATEIWVNQSTAGAIQIRYWDNAAGNFTWNGTTNAWVAGAGAGAYAGVLGTTYRADVISNGTAWYVVIYDENDTVLETSGTVTWANTRAIANSLWVFSGDDDTTNYRSNMYLDYFKIEVGALTTTFEAEDSEHPDWYRAYATFTMPSTTVLCGVEVKAGRYVYVDDFQIEAKAYPTPSANGDLLGCAWSGTAHDSTTTRTAGQCKLNNRNLYADHGAITGWYKAGLAAATMVDGYLLDIRGADNNNRIALYFEADDNTFNLYVNGAIRCTSAAQTFAAGDSIQWKVRWDFSSATSNLALQLNGGTETTASASLTAPYFSSARLLYIGSDYAGANQMDGVLYDVRIWGDALTAAQGVLDYTAGRGLGELPWLWTAAADGVVYNHEDSAHGGSAWLGGVPGDISPGAKVWLTHYFGSPVRYTLCNKPLVAGPYQAKYPYVIEAEGLTWPGVTEFTEVDADHSGGNYETITASDNPYGYLCSDVQHLFKLQGRWRVYVRAACTGAATADWNIAIDYLDNQSLGALADTRRYPVRNVGGCNTVDYYFWLDLGIVDIWPGYMTDIARQELFASATANVQVYLDINEAAAAEAFRMDCLELLPDDNMVILIEGTIASPGSVLLDTTNDTISAAGVVTYPGTTASPDIPATTIGAYGLFYLSPSCVNRIIARIEYSDLGVGQRHITAGTGGTAYLYYLDCRIEPRFEALR